MKSNKETYLNQAVHEYKRLIVSGFNDLTVNSIMGTETQQCTDVPTIDLNHAPDLRTVNDIRRRILKIMDSRVSSSIAEKVFAHAICKKAAIGGLETSVFIKEPYSYHVRSTRPAKEDDDRWCYHQELEVELVDRSTGHTVLGVEFTVLGGYVLKKDCTIHLFTKHLEEQVDFLMPYLEKGIKDYLKTKRDSV